MERTVLPLSSVTGQEGATPEMVSIGAGVVTVMGYLGGNPLSPQLPYSPAPHEKIVEVS